MEYVLNNGLNEISEKDMRAIDGGIGLIGGMVIAWVVDGVVEATTGKSVGGWVATGITGAIDWLGN